MSSPPPVSTQHLPCLSDSLRTKESKVCRNVTRQLFFLHWNKNASTYYSTNRPGLSALQSFKRTSKYMKFLSLPTNSTFLAQNWVFVCFWRKILAEYLIFFYYFHSFLLEITSHGSWRLLTIYQLEDDGLSLAMRHLRQLLGLLVVGWCGGQQELDSLRQTVPGEPGLDYPILANIPETSFQCQVRARANEMNFLKNETSNWHQFISSQKMELYRIKSTVAFIW